LKFRLVKNKLLPCMKENEIITNRRGNNHTVS